MKRINLFYTCSVLLISLISGCAYNIVEDPQIVPQPTPSNNNNQKYTVTASGMTFTPSSLTISIGDTVIFDNVSGFHNVNGTQATFSANPASFGNTTANAPWNYTFVFTVAGNYTYQCDVHAPGMAGTITVQ